MAFTPEQMKQMAKSVWEYQTTAVYDQMMQPLLARLSILQTFRQLNEICLFEDLPAALQGEVLLEMKRAANIGQNEEAITADNMLQMILTADGFKRHPVTGALLMPEKKKAPVKKRTAKKK
jgi:hypothetical protein